MMFSGGHGGHLYFVGARYMSDPSPAVKRQQDRIQDPVTAKLVGSAQVRDRPVPR